MALKLTVMNKRNSRKRSLARSPRREYTVYVEPRGKGERPYLPQFEPINLKQIQRETGRITVNNEQEIIRTILLRLDMQQTELLRALGLDTARPDYVQAFLELAKIHHGMGILLVERARASNNHAAKWSREQDAILKSNVAVRRQCGMTATEALRDIAKDKDLYLLLPVAKHSRSEKPAAIRREQKYKKRLAFILKRDAAENEQSKIIEGLAKVKGRQLTPRKRNPTDLGKSRSSKS